MSPEAISLIGQCIKFERAQLQLTLEQRLNVDRFVDERCSGEGPLVLGIIGHDGFVEVCFGITNLLRFYNVLVMDRVGQQRRAFSLERSV